MENKEKQTPKVEPQPRAPQIPPEPKVDATQQVETNAYVPTYKVKPEFKDAKVLLVGDNFGCGSSREHAPWALMGWGIRAIISTSFADIFRNNSVKNGLLPVVVDEDFHKILIENAKDAYLLLVTIDLNLQVIEMPDGNTRMFQIDSFTRSCLLNGVDQLGYIRSFEDEIEDYEGAHPVFI